MNGTDARLRVEPADDVTVVTLNRPEARNALDLATCRELSETFAALDASETGAILLRAAGPSFCAGADLKERRDKDESWVRQRRLASFEAYRTIARCRIPVIALVHGPVVGSGGEITMSCDVAYAVEGTTFRFPEAHWGTVGATQRLQRVVGVRTAKHLLFTGEPLPAEEAYRLGLVQGIYAEEDALEAALARARAVAEAPRTAMRLTKQAVDAGAEVTLEQGIQVEMRAIEHNLSGQEWRAGVSRFADAQEDPVR